MRNRGEGGLEQIGRIWYFTFYNLKGEQVRRSSKSELKSVAIEMLRKAKEELAKGLDPQAAKKVRYEDMREAIIKDYAENGKRMIPSYLTRCDAYFGGMQAIHINRATLDSFKDKLKAEGLENGSVNRYLSLIRRMFNLMIKQERLTICPKFPMMREGHVNEEGRFISNARQGFIEQPDFDKILTKLPERLHPIAMFLYETGSRVGAASRLTWKSVRFTKKGAEFIVPGELTKNGSPLAYTLSNELTAILRKQFRTVDGLVFDSRGLRVQWTRAVELLFMDGLLLHDMRRSAVRNMVRAGITEGVAMRISGHKTRNVFTRYNITSEDDLLDAKVKIEAYREMQRAEARQEAAGD